MTDLYGKEFVALTRQPEMGSYSESAQGGTVSVVDALAGDEVTSLSGVLGGIANYVLTRVVQEGIAVDEVLAAARTCGLFDGDLTEELDGSGTARKAAVLSSLAFGISVQPHDVFTRGIQELSAADLAAAKRLGFATKLVVTARRYSGFLSVGVEPNVIPLSHPLARQDGTTNTLIVDAALKGRRVFSGPDARPEVVHAVSADILSALSRHPSSGQPAECDDKIMGPVDHPGRFMVRCEVVGSDARDVIYGCLFSHGIGVDDSSYYESRLGNEVVVLTDFADRSCVERALTTLGQQDILCMSAMKVFRDEAPHEPRTF